jgi:hypothetical protein
MGMMTESSPAPVKPNLRTAFFVAVTAVSISCAFIIIAFVLGSFIAGTSLHDPDTCWLMALGRVIYTTGHLPPTDPFSYTFASLNLPFVMYQWLTELTFFLLFQLLGLSGMVMTLSVLPALTLIGMPLILSRQLPHTRLFCCAISVLLILSATTHVLMRPEIFSYFFLSVWMTFITLWRKRIFLSEKSALRHVAAFTVLMLIWANFHSAFMIGLVALLVVALSYLIESKLFAKIPANDIKLLFLAVAGATTATFVNPNFFKLWTYLPDLYFSPINQYIDELKPIGGGDLQNPTYYPFLVQSLVATLILVQHWRLFAKDKSDTKPATGIVFSTIAVVVCIYGGLVARRLMPFAAIILACDSIFLHYVRKSIEPESNQPGFWQMVEARLQALFVPTITNCVLVIGSAALFGAYITVSRIAPPQLPVGSYAFKVPLKATEFLRSIQPEGRVFNDAQYGDVLIWHLPQHPLVFIDTRFDMYGADFVRQYQTMRFATPGFEKLLAQYQISWLFLPADSPLAKSLNNSPNWKAIYSDDIAVILLKAATH